MAYNQQDGGAGDELDQSQSAGGPDGGQQSTDNKDTFFLPPSFHGSHDCKPGDKITLEVVGMDKDGDYEVRVVGSDDKGKDDWRGDMKKSLGSDLSGPETNPE
jgi:hypothetical protein